MARVLGAIPLMGGCIVIALHQYWRGATAIIVSLLGWILAVRGVVLLTVPQVYDAAGNALTGPVAYTALLGLAPAGLYLTYAGWIAPHRHTRPVTLQAGG